MAQDFETATPRAPIPIEIVQNKMASHRERSMPYLSQIIVEASAAVSPERVRDGFLISKDGKSKRPIHNPEIEAAQADAESEVRATLGLPLEINFGAFQEAVRQVGHRDRLRADGITSSVYEYLHPSIPATNSGPSWVNFLNAVKALSGITHDSYAAWTTFYGTKTGVIDRSTDIGQLIKSSFEEDRKTAHYMRTNPNLDADLKTQYSEEVLITAYGFDPSQPAEK